MGQVRHHLVGEAFPATILMRAGPMRLDGERGIEQKHPLPCPSRKVAGGWYRGTGVVVNFTEDVLKRRREWYAVVNGETQTIGLPHVVIRILPQNHHFNGTKRRGIEGGEYLRPGWEHLLRGILTPDEICERNEIVLIPLGGELLFPTLFYFDIHSVRVIESFFAYFGINLCEVTNFAVTLQPR